MKLTYDADGDTDLEDCFSAMCLSNPRFVCALPCAAVAALLRWPGVTVDGLAMVTGMKRGRP